MLSVLTFCLRFPDMPLASPENLKPEKSKIRFQTFLITLSPRDSVTSATDEMFLSYLKKKTEHAFVVAEFGENGKRHLHACCMWRMPVEKRNIQDYWAKIMTAVYPGSIGRYAVKVTTQYNHIWYNEYLRKGGDVLYDNYDPAVVERYFPTDEQQQHLIEAKDKGKALKVHIGLVLLDDWSEFDETDKSYEGAIQYLKHRMYILRRGPFFVDKRKLQQMAYFMYEARNGICDPDVSDRNYAAMLTGNTVIV